MMRNDDASHARMIIALHSSLIADTVAVATLASMVVVFAVGTVAWAPVARLTVITSDANE